MQKFFSEWISKFANSFISEKTDQLLILLDKDDTNSFESTYKTIVSRDSFGKIVYDNLLLCFKEEGIAKILSEFVINHFLYKIHKYRESYQKSFEHLKECFANLVEIYTILSSLPSFAPLIKHYMKLLYQVSTEADMELEKKSEKTCCIDECGRSLITFFSRFQNSEDKQVVLYCIIWLIKIYFKLKTYRSSKTLVEWVDKSGLTLEYLPKAEVTTFLYYSGRLSLYELKVSEAQEILSRAYSLCNKNNLKNKRLIYEYLIPLNLFYGTVPDIGILKQYELSHYNELIDAYKTGNLTVFERKLDALEDSLISLGTFLIFGKLKSYVFRNLIKIIYKCYQDELAKMKTPVMKIDIIYNVLTNVLGYTSIDMDELELYIIGVLYKGLISGYVHNANKVIVFSKKTPFPSLKSALKANYTKII